MRRLSLSSVPECCLEKEAAVADPADDAAGAATAGVEVGVAIGLGFACWLATFGAVGVVVQANDARVADVAALRAGHVVAGAGGEAVAALLPHHHPWEVAQ